MVRLFKDRIPSILLLLFFLSLFPFAYRLFENQVPGKAKNEAYDANLSRLNSSEKIIEFADSLYQIKHGVFDTASYVNTLSTIVKDRFHHGQRNYSFSENWIAWTCGKIFWSHFASIVNPEDILKHPQGLCSQQTIVFMHLLRIKKIDVRSVGLGYAEGPGHFLCEVRYGGSWHMHDVNLEPEWSKIVDHHKSLDYYLSNKDSLFLVYESKMPREIYNKLLEKTQYGKVNQMPARKMAFFHTFSLALTYILPPLFLLLYFRATTRKKALSHKKEEAEVRDPLAGSIADFASKRAG